MKHESEVKGDEDDERDNQDHPRFKPRPYPSPTIQHIFTLEGSHL